MALKYYYDLMSQPSRAVYMFLKLNKIPFEPKPVALRKGEHMTEEYKKLNPFQLVPVIDDNGFILTESVAILKYLACKYNVPEHWYPRSDLQKQAKIDEYANWQHINTRLSAAMLFRHLLIIPRATGQPPKKDQMEHYRKKVVTVASQVEQYFLNSKPFLCGDNMSIADLLGFCEFMQLYGVHEEGAFERNPAVKAWMQRVREKLQPVFEESHKVLLRVREVTAPAANL